MRAFLLLAAVIFSVFLSLSVSATDWEEQEYFDSGSATEKIRVVSSTDTSVFKPIIQRFLATNPRIAIEYLVAGSTGIYDVFRNTPDQFDVVISSAMDLQIKLVNDGLARSIEGLDHPVWAQWRQSLFGFTLEPAAIVVNKAAFAGLPIPGSRQEMIEVLRENIDTFKGRIGTYDVRESGLGYLFATQDARRSETYWRLMEIMGSLDARVYCCSSEMLDDVASGEIAISYNVLGSYAMDRSDIADKVEVILPSEFPTTMMRTAFVANKAPNPNAATSFVRFLTSTEWSASGGSSLPALQNASGNAQTSVISLEPSLMIFLDRMKRSLFIKEWERAIIQ